MMGLNKEKVYLENLGTTLIYLNPLFQYSTIPLFLKQLSWMV